MAHHLKKDGSVTVTGKDGRISGNVSGAALTGPGSAVTVTAVPAAPAPPVNHEAVQAVEVAAASLGAPVPPPRKKRSLVTHDEAVRRMDNALAKRGLGESFTPTGPFPGTEKPWPGECQKGHACSPTLSNVSAGQGICLSCAGRPRLTHDTALERMNSILKERGRGETFAPSTLFPGVNEPWEGTCPVGHVCRPRLSDVQHKGSGLCRECATHQPLTHEQAIERMNTALADRGRGESFTPSESFPGIKERWRGTCGNGHLCAPRLGDIRDNRGPCRECSGRLPVTHDEAVARLNNALTERGNGESFTPTAPFPGTNKPWPGLCGDGHACSPRLGNVETGGWGACQACAGTGFNPNKSAHLYLLCANISDREVAQFGISNYLKSRLRVHSRTGFTSPPVSLAHLDDGAVAAAAELEFKREQKRRGIPTATDLGLKFDGSTEAFILNTKEAEDFFQWLLARICEIGRNR